MRGGGDRKLGKLRRFFHFFSQASCSRLILIAADRKIGKRSSGRKDSVPRGKTGNDWLEPRELHPCGLFWVSSPWLSSLSCCGWRGHTTTWWHCGTGSRRRSVRSTSSSSAGTT